MSNTNINIFWFRRDLRLHDNCGLYHALRSGLPVLPVFIFDTSILYMLEDKADKRVQFIHQSAEALHKVLMAKGSGLETGYGKPNEIFSSLAKKYRISKVFTNHDYEPLASERDDQIKDQLKQEGIGFESYKDQVIFEKGEVVKEDGLPYTVFTPYSRKWKARLIEKRVDEFPSERCVDNFLRFSPDLFPSLKDIGFKSTSVIFPSIKPDQTIILQYDKTRDYPAINGTTRIGLHLRFGTISIRQLVNDSKDQNEIFLNELIWREFYQQILWHFPQVGRGASFKPEYDHIPWKRDNGEFEKWCQGMTGYPIVDAGMRELNETGYMHNRVRMITASFLSKHLLLDWRLGEAYFAQKLLDFELASNNGGWQWSSGSGCDAAPYFRIFNPTLQTQRFDPEKKYIRKWVPELETLSYPQPIVIHEQARKRCLEVYARTLKKEK